MESRFELKSLAGSVDATGRQRVVSGKDWHHSHMINVLLRIWILLLSGLLLALPAAARQTGTETTESTETEWLSILLEGRKVGHAWVERRRDADRVRTEQHMHFEVGRSGVNVVMTTQEVHEETPSGEPLAFTSVSTISGLEMRVEGQRQPDGRFAVKSGAAGGMRDSQLQWPAGALLSQGMELKLREAGVAPGTRIELQVFQPLLQDAANLVHEIIGPATVDLPGQDATAVVEARQTLAFPGGDMISRVWFDADLNLRKMTMDIMGQTLELLSCDRACAQAPNQAAEILTTSLVAAPRALGRTDLGAALVIELHSGVPLSNWPGIDGQRLQAIGEGRYRLSIGGEHGDPVEPPGERDLIATDWLDYGSPAVQALLAGVDLDAAPRQRMHTLEGIVHRHIDAKSLNIGYASASDSARLREGDCTEHAVLLAALGRAAGIPSRVVNGLAYTEDFGGGPNFVPHAWVAAWTGERWQAFDAALPGRQLRIALHADDGDPWRFYSNLDAFGQMRIDSIQRQDDGGE